MNKEFSLTPDERNILSKFELNTKYSVKNLQEATWVVRSTENYDPFGKIWLDSLDYEGSQFDIIADDNHYIYILTIYTND